MARTIDWIGNFHAIASCDAQMPNVDARRSRNRGILRDRFGALSVDTAVLDMNGYRYPLAQSFAFGFLLAVGGLVFVCFSFLLSSLFDGEYTAFSSRCLRDWDSIFHVQSAVRTPLEHL